MGRGHQDEEQDTSMKDMKDMMKQNKTMMDMMQELSTKFDSMNNKIEDLHGGFKGLQEEVKGLREEVEVLQEENKDLIANHANLEKRMKDMERKNDDLEGRSKRNNLIFYGMADRSENEDCEGMLRDLMIDTLDMDTDIAFDRVHRLSRKPDSPIIARCTFFKDKLRLLKSKVKLKGTDVFIGEDYSFRVRDVRRKLAPHLKKAREDGKRASMFFDYLLVDGKRFTLDDGTGDLMEMQNDFK